MLFRDGGLFCGGRSRFLDNTLGDVLVAQLDTGAAWSVLDADVADAMSLLNGDGVPARLS